MGEKTPAADLALIRNGVYDGAHAFAVHLEHLPQADHTDDVLRRLTQATSKPIMLLHYRKPQTEGTAYTDEERMALLERCIRCGATAIDLTADTYDASPLEFTAKPEAVDRQKAFIDRIHSLGGEVIMSSHITDQSRTCEQVLEQMKAVEARGCDIAKIVTQADTEEAFVEGIRTTLALRREMKVPFIHLLTGRFAAPHRFLAPTLGNSLTFCVERYTEEYNTSQPPVRCMLDALQAYGWHIDDGK